MASSVITPPPAVAPTATAHLVGLLHKSGLFKPEFLTAKLAEFDLPGDAPAAATMLVRAGLLTTFQSRLLMAGKYRGFKLGTYLIRDQIGRGGMGTVYLAEHVTLRRNVALKVLAADPTQRAAVERFLREARAAAALDHPNIVRVYDVLQTGELHYIVMEYVEGKTLEGLVQGGGAMAPGRAVAYISQAAAGLQHAYEKGFVHRDIKPANLMLAKDGTVKILDMGLARSLVDGGDRVTEVLDEGAVVGTADFISPEQATNQPGVDIRADIYSLGATLFALVTGQPPFTGNASQVLMQHQLKQAPSLTDFDRTIAPGLAAVVAQMLAKQPADRYATPADVIAALAAWLPNRDGAQKVMAGLSSSELGRNSGTLQNTLDQVMSGGTTRNLPKPALPAGRRTAVIAAGAAAAALVLAVGGYLVLGGNKSDEAARQVLPPARPDSGLTTPDRAVAVNPVPKRPAAKPVAAGNGAVKFRLAAADVPAFRNTKKAWTLVSGTDSTFAQGVYVCGHKTETVSEQWNEEVDGQRAFGFVTTSGPASAQLGVELDGDRGVQPPLPFVTGTEYTVRIVYKTAGPGRGSTYVQRDKTYTQVGDAWADLVNTGGAWKTVEYKFVKPAEPIRLLIDNLAVGADSPLYVREVTVREEGGAAGPAPLYAVDFAGLGTASQTVRDMPANLEVIEGVRLPKDVWVNHYSPETAGLYTVGDFAGSRALGLRWLSGPRRGVQGHFVCGDLLTLLPVGEAVVVRLTYANDGPGDGTAFVEQNMKPEYPKHASVLLPPTGGQWETVELAYTQPARMAPTQVVVRVGNDHADRPQPTGTIWVKAVEVLPGEASTAAAPVPAPATPAPAAPAAAAVGAKLFDIDLTAAPVFRGTITDTKFDTPPPTDLGLNLHCWKKTSVAAFQTGGGNGVGVTNLNADVSSQLHGALDGRADKSVQPNRPYVMRVEYKTANDAAGTVSVRTQTYSVISQAALSASADWRWVELRFTHPTDKLDFVIENAGVGEGNTLWVRRVEVYEAK